jgi:hypothetical protein
VTLSEIRERVERSTSSWDCDVTRADIAEVLGAEVTRKHGRIGLAYRNVPWVSHDTSRWQSIPAYLSDTNSVLSLIERVLPTAKVSLNNWPGGDLAWQARLVRNGADHRAPTAPLALLRALLAALEASNPKGEDK